MERLVRWQPMHPRHGFRRKQIIDRRPCRARATVGAAERCLRDFGLRPPSLPVKAAFPGQRLQTKADDQIFRFHPIAHPAIPAPGRRNPGHRSSVHKKQPPPSGSEFQHIADITRKRFEAHPRDNRRPSKNRRPKDRRSGIQKSLPD